MCSSSIDCYEGERVNSNIVSNLRTLKYHHFIRCANAVHDFNNGIFKNNECAPNIKFCDIFGSVNSSISVDIHIARKSQYKNHIFVYHKMWVFINAFYWGDGRICRKN